MKVRFLQPIAGTNPDGTALFIDAHQEVDYPDFEAHRLIGRGFCVALDEKDQAAAMKQYAKEEAGIAAAAEKAAKDEAKAVAKAKAKAKAETASE